MIGKNSYDAGFYYAPYIPLSTTTAVEYYQAQIFDKINIKDVIRIKYLHEIRVEHNTLCRVTTTEGNSRFIYPMEVKHGYHGVSDDEPAIYVADYIPSFKFMDKSEEAREFLQCSDEEFLMFVLKYGSDFPQG